MFHTSVTPQHERLYCRSSWELKVAEKEYMFFVSDIENNWLKPSTNATTLHLVEHRFQLFQLYKSISSLSTWFHVYKRMYMKGKKIKIWKIKIWKTTSSLMSGKVWIVAVNEPLVKSFKNQSRQQWWNGFQAMSNGWDDITNGLQMGSLECIIHYYMI